MNRDGLTRHNVSVTRDFEPELPEIAVDKHKVLQILVNLIVNAGYACHESNRPDKSVTVRVIQHDDCLRISVADNGVGIAAEKYDAHFLNHGFTTREHGHGYGLHGGALAAKELGGSLRAESQGLGKGAEFILELPLHASSAKTLIAVPAVPTFEPHPANAQVMEFEEA